MCGSIDDLNPWAGNFGRAYTDRNDLTPIELDRLYLQNYGISRSRLNNEFLARIPFETSILEVGCNVGVQSQLLSQQGYKQLSGIDLSLYALNLIKSRHHSIDVLGSSALYIPFKTHAFDLVFCSGVLIHVNPKELNLVLDEIHRCSRKYIWCFEYYSDEETEVLYREKKELLWKNDFLGRFIQRFPDLSILQEMKLKYTNNDNVDIMFLLEKTI